MLSYTGMKIANEYYKSQKDTQHGVDQTLPINDSWYRSMVTSHGPGPLDRIAEKIPYFLQIQLFLRYNNVHLSKTQGWTWFKRILNRFFRSRRPKGENPRKNNNIPRLVLHHISIFVTINTAS